MKAILVAIAENNCIGKENKLIWSLPEDMKYFRETTTNHSVVMGRKTYESIGRALPNRINYVLTRDNQFKQDNVTVLHDITEIQTIKDEKIFVIGGAQIYKDTMDIVDYLYVTHIHQSFDGDAFFPEINPAIWEVISSKKGIKNEKNPYDYEFVIYKRK